MWCRGQLMVYVLLAICSKLSKIYAAKNLVLVGGGLDDYNAPIWNKIIELAGGRNVARMGIITAASFDPADSAAYYQEMLLYYGAAEVYWIPVHEANKAANSDPVIVSNIRRMTGFIFGGGDQSRVINSFFNQPGRVESPALIAIRETYQTGAVIAGSSAGVACLPWPVMIAGGVTYNGLRDGSKPLGTESSSSDLVYNPDGGLGLMYDFVLDTHFSERGREGRLIRLLADTRTLPRGAQFGIGIDEDTSLVVTDADTPNASGQVIGVAGVFFANVSRAYVDPGSPTFRILDVRGTYLTQGDRINLRTGDVTFDTTWKSNMNGSESQNNALTSSDIFGGHLNRQTHSEFVRVARSLLDARVATETIGDTKERNPQFRVTFTQDVASAGYGGVSPVSRVREISYSNLKISIASVR